MSKKERFWSVTASAAIGMGMGYGYYLLMSSMRSG
jgi:hypothetical protein